MLQKILSPAYTHRMLNMDSRDVRRAWLERGGDYSATAQALGCKRQTVDYHVRRANELHPLSVPNVRLSVPPETDQGDRDAIATYVRACLERAGVSK